MSSLLDSGRITRCMWRLELYSDEERHDTRRLQRSY